MHYYQQEGDLAEKKRPMSPQGEGLLSPTSLLGRKRNQARNAAIISNLHSTYCVCRKGDSFCTTKASTRDEGACMFVSAVAVWDSTGYGEEISQIFHGPYYLVQRQTFICTRTDR